VLAGPGEGPPRRLVLRPRLFSSAGLGVMLTPSVNVVQSDFRKASKEKSPGYRAASPTSGPRFGTAIAGTILVAGLADPKRAYGVAMIVLAFIGLIGRRATVMLRGRARTRIGCAHPVAEHPT